MAVSPSGSIKLRDRVERKRCYPTRNHMERESLEMDVVFVGAGPANLSGALHLTQLIEKAKSEGTDLGEIQIAVIEKGASVGAHILSGAVMDPKGLAELIPDFVAKGAPLESEVKERSVSLSHAQSARFVRPINPPPLNNHGYYIVSLNRLTAWLGEQCEAAGVNIFPEFPGAEMPLIYDHLWKSNPHATIAEGSKSSITHPKA